MLTVLILDFKFWILDYFWFKPSPWWAEQIALLRQSKISKLHPLVGAVNPKSSIQNLKLFDAPRIPFNLPTAR
ncbi:hypothetical protein [Nostoc sp. MS1]|uniref:hypothetical protein n=1 Tax=Nostoc sp. MS1 TaxID=2764711 RepID=UPI001CC700E6|nr:hypothetical protein [Nostoc sp. MS1]